MLYNTEPSYALSPEDDDDFTELTNIRLIAEISLEEQLNKLRKKLIYSRRKSSAQFYEESSSDDEFDYLHMR
jgi:hypothetical protein